MELTGRDAFDEADGILQEEGDANRGDERHETRRVPQRSVGNSLDQHGGCPGNQHALPSRATSSHR